MYAVDFKKTPFANMLADNQRGCRVCGEICPDTQIQDHVGGHILRAMRGVPETKKITNPVCIL